MADLVRLEREFAFDVRRATEQVLGTPSNTGGVIDERRASFGGVKVFEGILQTNLEALDAALDAKTDKTTTTAKKLTKDPDNPGDLKEATEPVTLTNRRKDLSGNAGDYVLWTIINGEKRVFDVEC